jgi:hypothetical protein
MELSLQEGMYQVAWASGAGGSTGRRTAGGSVVILACFGSNMHWWHVHCCHDMCMRSNDHIIIACSGRQAAETNAGAAGLHLRP